MGGRTARKEGEQGLGREESEGWEGRRATAGKGGEQGLGREESEGWEGRRARTGKEGDKGWKGRKIK